MLTRNHIRSLGGIQHLCGLWEGTADEAEFMNFGGGCTNGEEILIRPIFLKLFLTALG